MRGIYMRSQRMIWGLLLSVVAATMSAQAESISISLKADSHPSLANLVRMMRAQASLQSEARPSSWIKSRLEKNIIQSLSEESMAFLNELSLPAIESLLRFPDGIFILQRVDALMTTASQNLAEIALVDLQKTKKTKTGKQLQQIRRLERARDVLAQYVARKINDSNFNAVFDYMIQSHYRRTEGLSQGLIFPTEIKGRMYGHKNPNQTAFQTLKRMTMDVLASNATGPLQDIRLLKISGTAQMIPPFKPTLESWEVEAYYFRRSPSRLPSSVQGPRNQASSR